MFQISGMNKTMVALKIFYFLYTLYTAHLTEEIHAFARNLDSEAPLHLDIRRSHVLFDAMREAKKKKFTTSKMVQVNA